MDADVRNPLCPAAGPSERMLGFPLHGPPTLHPLGPAPGARSPTFISALIDAIEGFLMSEK